MNRDDIQEHAFKTVLAQYKLSFSATPEGHAYDAAHARQDIINRERERAALDAYGAQAPVRGFLTGANPLARALDKLHNRNDAYIARRHEGGGNAYNPFGGYLTPSEVGSDTSAPKLGFSVSPEGHALDAARARNVMADRVAREEIEQQLDRDRPHAGRTLSDRESALRYLELMNRGQSYDARQHEAGRNAYNPFGGAWTPSETAHHFGPIGGDQRKTASSALDQLLGTARSVRKHPGDTLKGLAKDHPYAALAAKGLAVVGGGVGLKKTYDHVTKRDEPEEEYKAANFLENTVRSMRGAGTAFSGARAAAKGMAENATLGERAGEAWKHFSGAGGGTNALKDLAARGGAVAGTAALAGGGLRMAGIGGQQQPPPNPYYPQR